MKLVLKVLKYLALGFTALVLVLAVWLYFLHLLPTSEEMIEYWTRHRSTFENQQQLLVERSSAARGSKDADGTYHWWELDSDEGASVLKFYTHRRGIGVAQFGTGVAWRDAPPSRLYPDLDAMIEDGRADGFIGYAHLEGNWYYFMWRLN